MVLSMSSTNQLYLRKKVTLTTKFNVDSIFYVRYKSEEISPMRRLSFSRSLSLSACTRNAKGCDHPASELLFYLTNFTFFDGYRNQKPNLIFLL